MKVLVLSSGRTGASKLLDALWVRLGQQQLDEYIVIGEPFNSLYKEERNLDKIKIKGLDYDYDENGSPKWNYPHNLDDFKYEFSDKNVIVKMLVNKYHTPVEDDIDSAINFFNKTILEFDKLILLTRKNKSKRLKSALHAHQYNKWEKSIPGKNKKNDIILKGDDLDDEINDFLDTEIMIHELSKKHEVTYMEDIYSSDKELAFESWKKIFPGELSFNFNYVYEILKGNL